MRFRIAIFVFVSAMALITSDVVSAPARIGSVTFSLSSNGLAYAEIEFATISDSIVKSVFGANRYHLTLVGLPFEVDTNRAIDVSPDIVAVVLETGIGRTLMIIQHEAALDSLRIGVVSPNLASKTHEGKRKMSCGLSYQYSSSAFRELLQLPFCVSRWDYRIELPRKYSSDEISFQPSYMIHFDQRTFLLADSTIRAKTPNEMFVAFPDPLNEALQRGVIWILLFVGTLTALGHISVLRRRKIEVLLSIFAISLAIILTWLYFSTSLAEAIEFNVLTALFIPHAVISLFASLYILVSKKYQATIHGRVTLEGAPIPYAKVTLLQGCSSDELVEVASLQRLDSGNFVFHRWVRGGESYFQATGRMKDTEEVRSTVLRVRAGEEEVLGEINLSRSRTNDSADLSQ